jgi:hypothetical protein
VTSSPTSPTPKATATASTAQTSHRSRATVFGLDVCTDSLPPVLCGARAAATGHRLDLCVRADADGSTLDWPESGAAVISEQIARDGGVETRIEAHPTAGYLISGARYGAHLLSGDGRSAMSSRRGSTEIGWQRMLVAQVLPFAALLHGFEVFHASAVVFGGRAIGLAGPSRSGKSSVALELCRRGASFLADDVLALRPEGDALLAYPGCPVVSMDPTDCALARPHEPPQEVLSVDSRERLVRTNAARAPAALEALFFLDRRQHGPSQPRFEPVVDARVVLAATFNFVLAGPERLQRLLDVCALAAGQRVERVSIGASVDATQLAMAIAQRIGGLT